MIKIKIQDFVVRQMDLAIVPGLSIPEYVSDNYIHDVEESMTELPYLLISNPVDFDRFLQSDKGTQYKQDMDQWYTRWSQATHVSHIGVAYSVKWNEVSFYIVFKDDRSAMNGAHASSSGKWSSHT